MCVMVPVLTVLGLVLFLYQRECFLTTLALCGSFLAVWVCGDGLDSPNWRIPIIIGAVLGLLILAALALLVRKAQQACGSCRWTAPIRWCTPRWRCASCVCWPP